MPRVQPKKFQKKIHLKTKKWRDAKPFLVSNKFYEPLELLYAWQYVYYTIIMNFYRVEKIKKKIFRNLREEKATKTRKSPEVR